MRETFSLPLEQARAKAKAFLKTCPKPAYMSEVERWREPPDDRIDFRHAPTADGELMAHEEDKLKIVPERTVEVRETRTLFRLTRAPDHDLSRSSRQVAIVAAETEDKARQIDFLASDAIVDPTPDGAFQILPV